MQITNLLHFTEHHRFCTYRSFSLSPIDYKMLSTVYQPMVGAKAISLYYVLFQQLSSEQIGWSLSEQQRKLFLAMDIDLNETGRKLMIECTSKLEAIGLLETYRKHNVEDDEYIYCYAIQEPLSPTEFFQTQHLTLLLRDKVGKHMLIDLREGLFSSLPEAGGKHARENLSVPFYNWFELNTQVFDIELEESMDSWQEGQDKRGSQAQDVGDIGYADIITRFPKNSRNRQYVEGFKTDTDQLIIINYMVKKYNLSLQDVCRLLDEDELFDKNGKLIQEVFQYKANLYFRQQHKRDANRDRYLHRVLPVKSSEDKEASNPDPDKQANTGEVEMEFYLEVPQRVEKSFDVHSYNTFLRNEPYIHVLKKYFPGKIPEHVLNIFENIDINYKLKEEVMNVLIHYLFFYQLSWNKNFIDSIATDLLGKQIDSFEKAVSYIRQQADYKSKAGSKSSGKSTTKGRNSNRGQKPKIPIVQHQPNDATVTEEEYQDILKKYKLADET